MRRQRKYLVRFLGILHNDSTVRFSRLPREIRRYILAPMIIHPYKLVAINQSGKALMNRGNRAYIGTLRVGPPANYFAATSKEWITVGKQVTFTSVFGSEKLWMGDGFNQVTTGPMNFLILYSEYNGILQCELPDGSVRDWGIEFPDSFWKICYARIPQDPVATQIVNLIYTNSEIKMLIWNGSRTVVRMTCGRGRVNRVFKISIVKTFDVTPLAMCGTSDFGYVVVTWPWGMAEIMCFI